MNFWFVSFILVEDFLLRKFEYKLIFQCLSLMKNITGFKRAT